MEVRSVRKLSAKAAAKAADKLVEAAYYRVADRVQIPMMAIPGIYRAGRAALDAGADVDAAVKAAVDAVRVN